MVNNHSLVIKWFQIIHQCWVIFYTILWKSIVTNVESNACLTVPTETIRRQTEGMRYWVVEDAVFAAHCLQLLFLFGCIKLCCGFLCPLLLFSLISLFGFFLYWDSVVHSAAKWHLQTACCQITAVSIGNLKAGAGAGNYSCFGRVRWMPAFSWGMGKGRELILWLKSQID